MNSLVWLVLDSCRHDSFLRAQKPVTDAFLAAAGTGLERRWSYADDQVAKVIEEEPPADEREAVAMEFVRVASRNDAAVTDDLRARLAQHFTPQEVMEIVLVTGFWKMYNMMHVAMAVPIEDPVQEYRRWVQHNREEEK